MHASSAIASEREPIATAPAERGHLREIVAARRRGTADLLDGDDRCGAAAARPVTVRRVGREVVVDDHRFHGDPLLDRLVAREPEVDDVAGVVLDDVHDSTATVDGARRRFDLQHRRTGEDRAGDRRVEHAPPDEASV